MSFTRSRRVRALAAGTLSVALLSAGTAGAFAANEKPSPKPSTSMSGKPMPTTSPSMTKASLTITARPTTVKAGHTVVFTGRTTGLKVSSPLVLQQEKNGKWVSLRATGKVKRGSSYAISYKPTTKGTDTFRVASANMAGKAFSPTVTVTVN